jgi:hypothetical protein
MGDSLQRETKTLSRKHIVRQGRRVTKNVQVKMRNFFISYGQKIVGTAEDGE